MRGMEARGEHPIEEVRALRARVAQLEHVNRRLVASNHTGDGSDKAKSEWERILDASRDAVMVLDHSFTVVQANLATSRFAEMPLEKIIGQTCWRIVHGRDEPCQECPLEAAQRTRKHQKAEFYVRQRNIWIEVSVDPVLNDKGQVEKFIHITRDVTERKHTADVLATSEDRFRLIFENANDVVVFVNKFGRILALNKKIENMLGYDRDELIGRNFLTSGILAARNAVTIARLFNAAVSGNGSPGNRDGRNVMEVWLNHKNGHTILVEANTTAMRKDGELEGFVSILRDITERRKTQEREKRYIQEQEFFATSVAAFTQFPIGEDLYKYIAGRIRELAPDTIVAVNSYDKELGGLRVRELLGLGTSTQALVKLMGANPVGKCFEIDAAAREGLGRAELVKVPGGIYDLSPGIPRAVGQAIEKLLGLGDVYAMGLKWKEELLGSIIILTRSRSELSHRSLIETFLRQAAVALQRAEVESELQQSEKRLGETIDAVSLGTWDWNLTTGHIIWAGHHDRLFGFAPGEFDGRYETFESRIHPDDLPGFRQAVKQSLCLHADYAHEYRVVWPDGTTHWIAARGRYHWDREGQPTRMLGIISDITDRKQAEEAYRSLVDHSLQGLAIFQDGRVVFANRTLAQITGYSVEEMLSTSPEEVQAFVHPDDREMVWSRYKQRLKGEVLPEQYEIRGIRKDGSVCWLEIHANATEYHGRSAIQAAYVDITARKGVEKVLRESEQRLKILFESVPDGIYLNDMEGNLLDGNAAAERLTGYARQELIGKNLLEVGLLSPKEIPKAMAALACVAGGKAAGPNEFTLSRKDGTEVVVEIRAYPVEIDNRMLSLGIVRDITERKRAEHLLRRERDKAQQYLDVAAVMMVAVDSEQRVGLINKKGCEILGYEEQEILGKNWFDNFLPDRDRARVRAVFEGFAGGQARPGDYFENLVLTKDGRERLIAWHNTMLKDDEGNFVAILSSGEDITERRRAEDALRKQRLLSQVFLESMPCVALLLRPHTREVVAANRRAQEAGVVPGTTCYNAWAGRKSACPWCLASKVWETDKSQHLVVESEGIVWDAYWVPIEEDLYLHYAFDITSRTRVQEALRESEEHFRTAFEFSPNGMCLIDLDRRLISVNRAMSRIFGCAREKLQGKHLDDITHPEDRAISREALQRILRGEIQDIAFEKRYVRESGETICAQVSAVLLRDVSGKPIRFIAQIADVTERKKTQERLLEYQAKLKAMASEILRVEDRERKRIALGLHDNICQKLVLTKLAVESWLPLVSNAKLAASLKIAAEAIGETIEQTDTLTFELSDPVLREFGLVAAMETYITKDIQQKHHIPCTIEIDGEIDGLLESTESCLFRVMRELLMNVVKHARASKITVSIHKGQGQLCMSVCDDGIGFKIEEGEGVPSQKTRFGLFSVREQLEYLGGSFEISSEPGRGTTATVVVPLS